MHTIQPINNIEGNKSIKLQIKTQFHATLYIPVSLKGSICFPRRDTQKQSITTEMTAIIRITAPSPTTRIKLGCFTFFEETSAEGLDGRFGGASDGAVSEIGAAQMAKMVLQFQI